MPVINKISLKYNIIISLIMHMLFIVCAVDFYNSKKKLPTENYKIVEIDLISLMKKEKKIKATFPIEKKEPSKNIEKSSELIKKEKVPIPKKEVKPKVALKKKTQDQDLALKQNENFIKKKTKVNNKIQNTDISLEKDKKILSDSLEKEKKDAKLFDDYKIYLKNKIQKEASKNYPKISLRKKEEGNVEVIFTLDREGLIKLVSIGDKTNASKRIIDSLTKVLKNKIVKFEKSEILKKTNTFSIIIVYKLK